jgi:phenylacetate-CoA ligase
MSETGATEYVDLGLSNDIGPVRSAVPGLVWPAVPSADGALALAMQYQLTSSQWWSSEKLETHQFMQLERVMRHAFEQVPYYRRRLADAGYCPGNAVTPRLLARLPTLTRREVQSAGSMLFAIGVPSHHGHIVSGETSGSTGMPVVFKSSAVEQLMWKAFTLRDHFWHRRDLRGRLAAIRYATKGGRPSGWGVATDSAYVTGEGALLPIDTDVPVQVGWLCEQNPDYFLSYASNIGELALAFKERRLRLSRLREVRSVSEVVRPDLRALVREVWGVKLTDMYSAKEVGCIALQCPDHDTYHVQSENVLVEIVNEKNEPCAPGEIGRVLLTALHKFAMPLIRYEIGDYAVPGGACSCGRGLPVVREILGRTRNMLHLPGGGRHWPLCDLVKEPSLQGILQYQYVQRTIDSVEVHLVVGQSFSREMEPRLIEVIHRRLGYPFKLDLIYRDSIPRSPSGKFEDFRCEMNS